MNEEQPVSLQFILTAAGLLTVVLVGVVDVLLGTELATSLFYLIPIFVVTWITGRRRAGLALAVASAIAWFSAEYFTNRTYSSSFFLYWNGATRLVIFIAIAMLLASWKKSLVHARDLARTDYLTGALNGRAFYEAAQVEISRAARYGHTLSIAYLDLDNFKTFNDRNGHTLGDALLRDLVAIIKSKLRKADVIARVGGDEFVILLPETGEDGARAAMDKILQELAQGLDTRDWPATFSSGVVTYLEAPASVDEMIKCADSLMYSVKNAGKNAVQYSVCSLQSPKEELSPKSL